MHNDAQYEEEINDNVDDEYLDDDYLIQLHHELKKTKQQRKQAEQDTNLLDNRIKCLRNEEIKAIKRNEQMQRTTDKKISNIQRQEDELRKKCEFRERKARELEEKKDYVGAIDGMTKVLRMDDSYSYAVFYMGRSYQLLGDTGNAAGYYKRLIQSYPNSDLIDDARKYLNQLGDTSSIDAVDISSSDTSDTADSSANSSDSSDNSNDSSDNSNDSSDNTGDNTGDGLSDNGDGSGE